MPVSLMVPVVDPKDQANMIHLSDDSRSGSRSNDSGVAGWNLLSYTSILSTHFMHKCVAPLSVLTLICKPLGGLA